MKKLPALAFLALLFTGCDSDHEEAYYQGQPTSYWVARLKDEDVNSRRKGAFALGELGPDEAELTVQPLIAALKDPDKSVRFYSVQALGKLGPKAMPAESALFALMRDSRNSVLLTKEALRVWKNLELSKPSALNGH
jgi:hypothetical protein